MITCHAFDPAQADSFANWTFPAYRQLLKLEPAQRNPQHGDRRLVRPFAFVAEESGKVVGVILGCLPTEAEMSRRPAELLSIVVHPERRHQGIAGQLLERFEHEVGDAGARQIEAVYMTGDRSIESVERLLAGRGWSPPRPRMTVFRFTVEEAMNTPWFGRYRWRDHMEHFPWIEITDEALERLRASHRATGWIAEDLVPWQFDAQRVEPRSSLGIRLDGEVVGWVINHLLPGGAVRFTCSYIHPDLKRRGRIVPAYTESIRRLGEAGYSRCTFTVPSHHPEMVSFGKRWCGPWGSFVGETRSSIKALRAAG